MRESQRCKRNKEREKKKKQEKERQQKMKRENNGRHTILQIWNKYYFMREKPTILKNMKGLERLNCEVKLALSKDESDQMGLKQL